MQILLSLPPALAEHFSRLEGKPAPKWFAASDPPGGYLGSGGGTTQLLVEAWKDTGGRAGFREWLATDRKLIIHAGGQSRRLPAYAATSKILLPIPVFRWAKGQRLDQTLLDLQLPLYEHILEHSPPATRVMVTCGDVLLRSRGPLPPLPDVDVLSFGLWVDPETATRHGVFFLAQRAGATQVLSAEAFGRRDPHARRRASVPDRHGHLAVERAGRPRVDGAVAVGLAAGTFCGRCGREVRVVRGVRPQPGLAPDRARCGDRRTDGRRGAAAARRVLSFRRDPRSGELLPASAEPGARPARSGGRRDQAPSGHVRPERSPRRGARAGEPHAVDRKRCGPRELAAGLPARHHGDPGQRLEAQASARHVPGRRTRGGFALLRACVRDR